MTTSKRNSDQELSGQLDLFSDESVSSGSDFCDSKKLNESACPQKHTSYSKHTSSEKNQTSVSFSKAINQKSYSKNDRHCNQQRFYSKTYPSTHEKGLDGENRAVKFLTDKGYEIIDRNYCIRGGEIDIIAIDEAKDTLVFVEVKTLPHGDIETLAHVLGFRKQQNVIKTAKYYLQNHRQYNYMYIRFDVLALDVPGLEPVRHLVNAFSE